ncbi:hypothetical protein [Arthrobacter sp. NPDC080082]|uniref:hypothetical protein n=1 Tax=unclassified Arthrobacter TaxID=235627 RepID=UPI0034260C4E
MDISAFVALQNWGSVPDWFGAVGTVGAVAYALYSGLRGDKRLAQERQEAAVDRGLFRQEQAERTAAAKRRLAAQVTLLAQKVDSSNPSRNGFAGPAVRWVVHNGGNEPISMVAVAQRPIPSESESAAAEIAHSWAVIEAGGSREVLTQLRGDNFHPNREVQFTDGTGARWQRRAFGELRELAHEDPEAIELRLIS